MWADDITAAYEEVKAMVDANGDLDPTAMSDLKYLDNVISEANRLAPFPYTYRTCTKPWTVPGTDATLPVGMRVLMPISGYHMDPDLWESPKEFRPERFNIEVWHCRRQYREVPGLHIRLFQSLTNSCDSLHGRPTFNLPVKMSMVFQPFEPVFSHCFRFCFSEQGQHRPRQLPGLRNGSPTVHRDADRPGRDEGPPL